MVLRPRRRSTKGFVRIFEKLPTASATFQTLVPNRAQRFVTEHRLAQRLH